MTADLSAWTDEDLLDQLNDTIGPTLNALTKDALENNATTPEGRALVANTFRMAAAVFLEMARRLQDKENQ